MTNNENEEEDRLKRIQHLLDSEAETRAEPAITPKAETPKPEGTTKSSTPRRTPTPPPHIALDKDNLPLPRRVDEMDMGSTRVSPAAYDQVSRPRVSPQTTTERASQPRNSQSQPRRVPPPSLPKSQPWKIDMGKLDLSQGWGCLVRGFIFALFAIVILAILGGSGLVISYYRIARTLPSVNDLKSRASQFETTRILDRNGNSLYEIIDPNAGRRTFITLSNISPALVAATIATEDKDFYTHPGFDVWGIIRALWQNYRTDGQGGGASTITQQLARALLLTPEERAQRTYSRKAREIILSAEITRRYSKDEILELYLNEIYYGNLAYGIEAASETYFGKAANQLTLSEASFLAGLPQSPAVYDVYTNRDVTLVRQQQVLVLMYGLSQQRGCITVSNSEVPICVDQTAALSAADEMKGHTFISPDINARYPHWVNFIRAELEKKYDAQTIYRSGFIVYTTLDPALQNEAQRLVTEQVALLADKNAHNGALVAIKPSTGEILAMVGSPDFNNAAISGQINMAISPTRQPGSSIKPLTYVAAFEKGWTPSTFIWDVPTQFPDGANPPYEPRNYDGKFHGGMTLRIALANSFNIPAVKALQFVGIYDNPDTPEKDGMIAFAERLGITSLTRNDYGLSLTLGGGDVSLIEMVGAYSVFANGGKKLPPVSILKITTFDGEVVYEYKPPEGEQVIREEHAYLISSILSDNNARSLMFGPNSSLNLSFQVAAKTGTTNDIRDNWTLGYTPDLVTGVWVGNADYTPMVGTSGLSGAAPIWSQFMEYAVPYLTSGAPTPFTPPKGIIQKIVCRLSGAEPSNGCQSEYTEVFASDQPPLPQAYDLLRRVKIDLWTGYQASDACKGPSADRQVMYVPDPWARKWLETGDGQAWLTRNELPENPTYAPERECKADDPQPKIGFSLNDGQLITSTLLEINGTANADADFKEWRLEFGLGENPDSWTVLAESDKPVEDGTLTTWNLAGVPNGVVTLRLTLIGKNAEVDTSLRLNLSLPTPTAPPPTPTVTPLPTLPPTSTPTQIIIPPTNTPTQVIIPPTATATQVILLPTETPTLEPTPTETPTP